MEIGIVLERSRKVFGDTIAASIKQDCMILVGFNIL